MYVLFYLLSPLLCVGVPHVVSKTQSAVLNSVYVEASGEAKITYTTHQLYRKFIPMDFRCMGVPSLHWISVPPSKRRWEYLQHLHIFFHEAGITPRPMYDFKSYIGRGVIPWALRAC